MRTTLAVSVLAVAGFVSWAELTQPVESQSPRRLCRPRVSAYGTAENVSEARRTAIAAWAAAAKAEHGEDYARWQIAGVARLTCVLTPEGQRCQAAGSPCRDLPAGGLPGR